MSSFWGYKYLVVETEDHVIFLFFILGRTSIWFPTVAAPICISSNSTRGFLFSWSLPTLVISCFFNASILTSVKGYLLVVLICISMMISGAEHLFMYLLSMKLIISDWNILFSFFQNSLQNNKTHVHRHTCTRAHTHTHCTSPRARNRATKSFV